MVMAPLSNIRKPTFEIRLGIQMNNSVITIKGMATKFFPFRKYWYAIAPKSAGTTLLNAGCNASASKNGRSGVSMRTPSAITMVVTKEEVAMESVDTISFSGVPASVPTISLALRAQGIFILIKLPVMKPK